MMIEPGLNSVATTISWPSSETATSPVICIVGPALSESTIAGTLPLTSQTRIWLPGLIVGDTDHVVVYASDPRTNSSAVSRDDGSRPLPSTLSVSGVVRCGVVTPSRPQPAATIRSTAA